jgi:hypothetical protein
MAVPQKSFKSLSNGCDVLCKTRPTARAVGKNTNSRNLPVLPQEHGRIFVQMASFNVYLFRNPPFLVLSKKKTPKKFKIFRFSVLDFLTGDSTHRTS